MNNENMPGIPDEVMDEVDSAIADEEIIGQYMFGGSKDSEKLSLVEQWFPDNDNMYGKTNITEDQARAIAVAGNLPVMFPEMSDEHAKFIDGFLHDYTELLTSVEGEARNQQVSVLQAMFSKARDEVSEAQNWAKAAISAQESDDE